MPRNLTPYQVAQEAPANNAPTAAPRTGTAQEAEHGGGSPLKEHDALESSFSGLLVAVLLLIGVLLATRNLQRRQEINRLQLLAEMAVEGLRNFARSTIGPGGEKFLPLIGSLFLFILFSNLAGALPFVFKKQEAGVTALLPGPMANISMTFALATIVFFTVQYVAIKEQGVAGRLKHLAGPIPMMAPLIFLLEVVGELVRPISLSIRLFGNIFGEETIVAVLVGLLASGGILAFLPLHLPIVIFGLLTAVVQAGVFTLLTCIYLQLAMAHHDDHGHDDHGHHGETREQALAAVAGEMAN